MMRSRFDEAAALIPSSEGVGFPDDFAGPRQTQAFRRKRALGKQEITMILVADDDADFAENCSMVLESHGYDVSVVLSGGAALARIEDRQPDLLISDCCMPDFGGPELNEQLKTRPVEQQFPVLLMSGSLRCEIAPGDNYDGFLRKPFLAEELLLQVRKALRNSAGARQACEEAQ